MPTEVSADHEGVGEEAVLRTPSKLGAEDPRMTRAHRKTTRKTTLQIPSNPAPEWCNPQVRTVSASNISSVLTRGSSIFTLIFSAFFFFFTKFLDSLVLLLTRHRTLCDSAAILVHSRCKFHICGLGLGGSYRIVVGAFL
jgi:hypothetical protein